MRDAVWLGRKKREGKMDGNHGWAVAVLQPDVVVVCFVGLASQK